MNEYFSIKKDGMDISCRIFRKDTVKNVIICGHGFAGHKDSNSVHQLAETVMKKCTDTALISFDWPCCGDDAGTEQRLSKCEDRLRTVIAYAEEQFHPESLYGYAVSFGGYLFLKYIAENGMPFRKAAFRCPAVNMYDVLCDTILTAEQLVSLQKGETVQAGFDRKVPADSVFLNELKGSDITKNDYRDHSDDLLIIHGTEDEIVPPAAVKQFAQENGIRLIEVEGADHRFTSRTDTECAAEQFISFFSLKQEKDHTL